MSTVVLELPDEQVKILQHMAQQRGASVNEVISELVRDLAARGAITKEQEVTQDSLYNIKSHESAAPPDLSQKADVYLYGDSK